MLAIGDILVSEEIFEKKFVCDLQKCKGACCIEGDCGAPLKKDEIEILEKEYENYKPYLTSEGIQAIEQQGFYDEDVDDKSTNTPLIDGGPCAYINYKDGISYCGIEKAYLEGKTSFRKPISCHLYPIRVSGVGELQAVNYERWSICADACTLGESLSVPVYKFLKEPIERAFGKTFYEILEDYNTKNNG
jgi:hypothetical protein